jgi:hypothetical protein
MKTVVYLYASEQDAKRDRYFQATGFIVSVPASDISGSFKYLVTNEHVVQSLNFTVFARISRKGGGVICLRVPKTYWKIDRKNDIAVAPVDPDYETWDFAHVGIEQFASPESVLAHKIGPGDEIYLISRTVIAGAKQIHGNFSIVRFGNVAMSPNQDEPYFLVELRSVGGHSGSPVFVYDLPYHWNSVRSRGEAFKIFLLGINCGHIRDYSPILTPTESGELMENKKWVAEHHISIAEVQPIWKLLPLLNCKKFVRDRDAAEKEVREQLKYGSFVHD